MVATTFFLSFLAATLPLSVLAAPQNNDVKKPVPPSTEQLEAIKMVFPPTPEASKPIEGKDNSTLIVAAPQLQEIVNTAPTLATSLRKRSMDLAKREKCDGNPDPHALWTVWDYYTISFCNHYFPVYGVAYYVPKGTCVEGTVPKSPPAVPANLKYKYCARSCGAHLNFVAITNSVCKAQFKRIIYNAINSWTCPGYTRGPRPGIVAGGDNTDIATDAATWSIDAS